jgi:uncharacterized protein YjeT (DUF2065 family)
MKLVLYFLLMILFVYGILCLTNNKKEKRIFHVMAYVVPLWVWGIFFLCLSVIFWYARLTMSHGLISTIFSLIFFVKGTFILFFPKRKIKKSIERWENFPLKKKRIFGGFFLILAFLIYLIIL